MSVDIVVGLGFGDEGKGISTDFLCRKHKASWVVRYNGGNQAAHNVIHGNHHHTFSQFGSGTFAGCNTYLSRFMMVNPIALVSEAKALSPLGPIRTMLEKVFIDPRCPILTQFHIGANRIRAVANGHGSCGKGIGELAQDLIDHPEIVITAKDLLSPPSILVSKFTSLWELKLQQLRDSGFDVREEGPYKKEYEKYFCLANIEELASAFNEIAKALSIVIDPDTFIPNKILSKNVVFEGAQGILLDEWHGFHPHTTWSNTTPENALTFLEEASYTGPKEIVGITRPYHTRHGNGPMLENPLKSYYHEHNIHNEWQGDFRYGFADGVLWKYAGDCMRAHGGLDKIMLTHADYFKHNAMISGCSRYRDVEGDFKVEFDPTHDLQRIEALGRRLKSARTAGEVVLFSDDFMRYAENKLQAPIAYFSRGAKTGLQEVRKFSEKS